MSKNNRKPVSSTPASSEKPAFKIPLTVKCEDAIVEHKKYFLTALLNEIDEAKKSKAEIAEAFANFRPEELGNHSDRMVKAAVLQTQVFKCFERQFRLVELDNSKELFSFFETEAGLSFLRDALNEGINAMTFGCRWEANSTCPTTNLQEMIKNKALARSLRFASFLLNTMKKIDQIKRLMAAGKSEILSGSDAHRKAFYGITIE